MRDQVKIGAVIEKTPLGDERIIFKTSIFSLQINVKTIVFHSNQGIVMNFKLFLVTVALFTSQAVAADTTLSDKDSRKALAYLITQAPTMAVIGDVTDEETLPSILALALAPGKETISEPRQKCTLSKIGDYDVANCALTLNFKDTKNGFSSETELTYTLYTALDGEEVKTFSLYSYNVRVSRGD